MAFGKGRNFAIEYHTQPFGINVGLFPELNPRATTPEVTAVAMLVPFSAAA